ncbi:flagellar assembly protein FliH [Aquibacillus kalidii]|uniref:flagellar assembly protein FliH n=1 Tax=Aquibacillus kalidii TaxID=2762597 RepID=UPI00164760AD|nr:flagellar assembly protein FliH [Aquibacillus kalidii]
MSSIYRYDDQAQKKIIGIKPIIVNRPQDSTVDIVEDELRMTEEKLEATRAQLTETQKEIEDLLTATKETIELEKQQWESEKQAYIQQAQQEGYQAGFQTGKEDSHSQYIELIDYAKSIVDLAKQDYQSIIEQSEEDILKLSVEVASKVVHMRVEQDNPILQIVKGVLREVKEQPSILVFAHPEDYTLILESKQELSNIVGSRSELSIYPDTDVEKGGCVIETPYGKIDASIEGQLQELRNKLFNLSEEVRREHSRLS